MLCDRSDFFRAALRPGFKEANEGVVRLPEADQDSFEVFARWAYTGGTILIGDALLSDDDGSRARARAEQVKLYILADQLGASALRREIIDDLIDSLDLFDDSFGADAIGLAYQHLPQTSGLRKLVLRCFACDTNTAAWLRENHRALPAEFVVDVAILVAAHLREKDEMDLRTLLYRDYYDRDGTAPAPAS